MGAPMLEEEEEEEEAERAPLGTDEWLNWRGRWREKGQQEGFL